MDITNIGQVIIKDTIAIIIAIESYRFSEITSVKYALKDAEDFQNVLISSLGVKEENIHIRVDSLASNTALNDEIQYLIRNLTETDRFIFYYAGHGFYEAGHGNRLTAWDSSIQNLTDTTLSLNELVLAPLSKSKCKQSLIFLDACAKELKDKLTSRESIGELSSRGLEKYVKDIPYHAIYYACSPTEKSYSDDTLQNGIWSYFLFQGLSGRNRSALINGQLTDTSLRDYLKSSVQDFIATKTNIKYSQTPYATINTSNSFVIFEYNEEVSNPNEAIADEYVDLKLLSKDITLVDESLMLVEKAPGFKRSHYPPDGNSSSAKIFVISVFQTFILEELQAIYLKIKDVLNLRRKGIIKNIDRITLGEGEIITDYFVYRISIQQSNNYIKYAFIKRQLSLKAPKESLPFNFDYIFPVALKVAYFPVQYNENSFESLVSEFEDSVEEKKGSLVEDDIKETIKYTTNDKIVYEFFIKESRLKISIEGHSKIVDTISIIEQFINSLT
ncbi:hypothetical protein G8759_10315 [Spirosoma aureum]|uniref:Peptidase C14 caspase domain-containing protein n=1 Tax=Spirosoma aureum TaxID=2692134 RepID=A0A6G9AKJ6_9BACT|nr:caspase family protein [Spirosoma aureum]QIP12991.1 hypothetical protein G8759_10315 [Spirosoma aureum]